MGPAQYSRLWRGSCSRHTLGVGLWSILVTSFPTLPPPDVRFTNLISVDNLITTTPIDPPFRAAIMQSGQTGIFGHPTNATHAWDSLAQQLNCSAQPDVLECVRAANVTTIISILELSNLLFSPVKDNITDLLYPETALETGNVSHVPVLLGTTAQDGGVYGERQFY